MSTCPIFPPEATGGPPYRRKAPGPHGFHQKVWFSLSQPDHFFRLGGVIRHRLFHTAPQPRRSGRGHIIHMGVVRRGDIHHVRLGLPGAFFQNRYKKKQTRIFSA